MLISRIHDTNFVPTFPSAVFFDTDNTLYDYSPADAAAYLAVRTKACSLFDIPNPLFDSEYRLARTQIKQQLGPTASSHSRLLYFQRFIELLGYKAQLLTALDLEQTYWRTFLANAPLFPNVVQCLTHLKSWKIPIAIITDLTSNIQLRKLTYFSLENTFDAVITSEEVCFDKPHPSNFELALQKLNLSSDSHFWMIGDNPHTDIMGAKPFNSTTFQKVHPGVITAEPPHIPDFCFSSYADLLDFLTNYLH